MSTQSLSPRVSAAMRDVLRACSASRDGIVRVADLVDARVEQGATLTVARASLSRTLRRLWRAGLIELASVSPWRAPDAAAFAWARQQAAKYRTMAEDSAAFRRAQAFRKANGFAPEKYR